MKKNKGFTLIELLAVIVILAIIALIAVPVVMNIIGKANKSAFKDSAYGIIKAGELFYTDQLLENAGNVEETTFNFPDDIEGLEFKGSKPSKGSMTVRKDGKISMAITNGKYCVTKGFEDDDVSITDDVTNCELGHKVNTLSDLARTYTFTKVDGSAYETPTVTVPECITDKTKCEAGTPVAVEVASNTIYKFYVLNDDITKNEVTLIMDRNLYSAEDYENDIHNVAWINAEDYGDSIIKNDKGPLTALKVLKERTSGWTNIPAYTYTLVNDEDGRNGDNTYPNITVTDVMARLPRREEIKLMYNNAPELWLTENFFYGDDKSVVGYWTSTLISDESSQSYVVEDQGSDGVYLASAYSDYASFGLRPVITLSK